MQKDTKTEKKIRLSSLCRSMNFTVPTSWKELSQSQLRFIIRLLVKFSQYADWENHVKLGALMYFCGFKALRRTEDGWLCQDRKTRRLFILNPNLLPIMLEKVDFVVHTDTIDVRIEKVGEHNAYDFPLREMPFGNYLKTENYFQSYLAVEDKGQYKHLLEGMVRELYNISDDEKMTFKEEELFGAFMWFAAAKAIMGEAFPNFLKPAKEAVEVTRESMIESFRAQVRLLTKGDVTKNSLILENIDTWTALAELDALAKEAEELKNSK